MSEERNPQLREVWRRKVLEAQRVYLAALNHVQEIHSHYKSMPSSDGNFAFQQALQTEVLAREEYTRALQTFTRLVVSGQESPDDATQTSRQL